MRLEHLIASANVVEISLLIGTYVVTGIDHGLGTCSIRRFEWMATEHLGRGFSISPIPQCDGWATMHQFTGLACFAWLAFVADHQDLSIGNRLPDRGWAAVNQCRR